MITTLSGSHPYRPQCAARLAGVAAVEQVTVHVDAGRCPRCHAPLSEAPILPAGSRVTDCRCIPLCEDCGAHEARVFLAPIEEWPVGGVAADLGAATGRSYVATVDPAEALGMLSRGGRTGGWLEHGHDDSADRDEQAG